jgi:hypothetical protein
MQDQSTNPSIFTQFAHHVMVAFCLTVKLIARNALLTVLKAMITDLMNSFLDISQKRDRQSIVLLSQLQTEAIKLCMLLFI